MADGNMKSGRVGATLRVFLERNQAADEANLEVQHARVEGIAQSREREVVACCDLQPRARDLLAPRRFARELDCKRRRNSCQAACCNRSRLDEMHARRRELCSPAAREMNEIDAKVSPAVAQ